MRKKKKAINKYNKWALDKEIPTKNEPCTYYFLNFLNHTKMLRWLNVIKYNRRFFLCVCKGIFLATMKQFDIETRMRNFTK